MIKTKNIGKIFAISIIGIMICSGTLTVSACNTKLIAGQEEIDGNVHIKQIGSSTVFRVEYSTWGGWTISEYHLAVAADPSGIPQNKKGNPKIGHFPFKDDKLPEGTTSIIFDVDLADYLEPGYYNEVIFAIHAVVSHPDYGEETAWADTYGERFTDNNWAMFARIPLPLGLTIP